jgi:hypothetical protein
LYVEVAYARCIDFVNPKECGSIMAKECRITCGRCLLEKLEVDGFIQHVHISNIENLLSFLSTLHNVKSITFEMYSKKLKKIKKDLETTRALCIYCYLII